MPFFAMLTTEGAIKALIWIVAVAIALTFAITRGLPALWRNLRGASQNGDPTLDTASKKQPQGPASPDQPGG